MNYSHLASLIMDSDKDLDRINCNSLNGLPIDVDLKPFKEGQDTANHGKPRK